MHEHNYHCYPTQFGNKYKVLKRNYSNARQLERKSVEGVSPIKFGAELRELFGDAAEIMPTILVTAQRVTNFQEDQGSHASQPNTTRGSRSSPKINLKEYFENARKERHAIMEMTERYHRERMAKMDELIACLKERDPEDN